MKRIFLLIIVITLFVLVGCSNKNDNSNEQYEIMYNHLVDCWSQSLDGIHFDNAFYGDSRVIGGSFVSEFKDKSVVNLGVGGDKIIDLINRFDLIKSTTPNIVFLAIGGNDCISSSYSLDKFKSEYRTLLEMFKENNINVAIHNIVGLTTANSSLSGEDVENVNKKIEQANLFIKDIALEYNYTFIDIASKMNKENSNEMNPLYSADGVHFNEVGYDVWFNEIRNLIY